MRRTVRFLVTTLLVIAAVLIGACTSDSGEDPLVGPEPAAGAAAAPSTTLAPPGAPPATVVIQEALPEPVPIEGEPTEWRSGPSDGLGTVNGFRIRLPEDYTSRHDLILCAHSDETGLSGCASVQSGAGGPIPVSPAWSDATDYSIVLFVEQKQSVEWRSLRRLAVFTREDIAENPWRLKPGYETVPALLTEPPPADGRYLEPDA